MCTVFNINKLSDHLYAFGRNVHVKCSLLYFFALLFIVFYIVHCILLCSGLIDLAINDVIEQVQTRAVSTCSPDELNSSSAPCRTQAVTAHAHSLTGIRRKFTSLSQVNTQTLLDRLKRSSFSQRDKMIKLQ